MFNRSMTFAAAILALGLFSSAAMASNNPEGISEYRVKAEVNVETPAQQDMNDVEPAAGQQEHEDNSRYNSQG